MRAGLEDHFCGKLLGLPMGCDVCYTNHAEADQNDMDALLTLLGPAGVNFVMGVLGADDVMLGYQSTSFHDALATRRLLGRRPAPDFEAWLVRSGVIDEQGALGYDAPPARFAALLGPGARRRASGLPQKSPSTIASPKPERGRGFAPLPRRGSVLRAPACRSRLALCWTSGPRMPPRAML
jgi:hypothetical protein